MIGRSPWRHLLYEKLSTLTLSGQVIDLGGSRKSAYLKNFKGDFSLTVADMADETRDILVNLEERFPIDDASYDAVLCINVLEHIFDYQNVIYESYRILKAGGKVIYAVPFLIQVHPSPHDYWRFTDETLYRLFKNAGFKHVEVEPIGTGICSATIQIKTNLLHFKTLRHLATKMAFWGDFLISKLHKKQTFSNKFYTLGYVISAQK